MFGRRVGGQAGWWREGALLQLSAVVRNTEEMMAEGRSLAVLIAESKLQGLSRASEWRLMAKMARRGRRLSSSLRLLHTKTVRRMHCCIVWRWILHMHDEGSF